MNAAGIEPKQSAPEKVKLLDQVREVIRRLEGLGGRWASEAAEAAYARARESALNTAGTGGASA